jgi:type I restriction enzyme, S subunit
MLTIGSWKTKNGGQLIAIVRPGKFSVNPKWLMHFLNAPTIRALIDLQSSGTTRRRISRGKLAQLELPVPPLPEQKRIADKVDSLLARVGTCRDRLDRIRPLLKRFRQAVYEAASSGTLTEDWRVERARGLDDWSSTSVEEVATLVFDGPFGSNLKSSDYTEAGTRVVRLENIAPLRFIEDKRTYIAEEKFQALARHTLLADDVLFSSFVDEEVRVCLLPPELSGKAINKAVCFCIRVDSSRCHPRFLALKLASRSTFSALDDVIHGATRPRINLGQLRAIAFHLPSIDEQTEIVQRVDSLFSVATAIESRLTAARAKVDRLTPALLAKAFTGELVPQDSDEEPAANMLARIRDHSESGEADRPKRSLNRPGF